jgi:SpoVK/Ycf46/Vps4 family AAA+-type ATPase
LSLEESVQRRLSRVVLEHRQQDRLAERGFFPLRKLLLVGPSGTGKTMTAAALAGEFHLPLFTIRLDGLITKFLGETAGKLRLVFDALAETPGVYLFDEIDALAGERARDNDVGEIRRVLNSFLQFLEEEQTGSLLVAATNHPQLLDRALFRRFDAVVEYPLPTPPVVRTLIKNRLATVKLGKLAWATIENAAAGLSHGEVTAAAERAAKDAILAGHNAVQSADLVGALRDRSASSR